MSLEDEISSLNERHFFREFTFSATKFSPTPKSELELADNVIWLADALFIYQLKERNSKDIGLPVDEERWFERKILAKAVKQIGDTLKYLNLYSPIEITNHRGHSFSLHKDSIRGIYKVIIYKHPKHSLLRKLKQKHYESRTNGFIHIFSNSDYATIMQTLLTPSEFGSYLGFRETIIRKWEVDANTVTETAILGQYISEQHHCIPNEILSEYVTEIKHDKESWDITKMVNTFLERITVTTNPMDYYKILTEIVSLTRNELKDFKLRINYSLSKCSTNTFTKPYRMVSTRTGCGFVFVPLITQMIKNRTNGLQKLTEAHKYLLQLPKCVGISFSVVKGGGWDVEWCYIEFPWEKDDDIDEMLKGFDMFRPVKMVTVQPYRFTENID